MASLRSPRMGLIGLGGVASLRSPRMRLIRLMGLIRLIGLMGLIGLGVAVALLTLADRVTGLRWVCGGGGAKK